MWRVYTLVRCNGRRRVERKSLDNLSDKLSMWRDDFSSLGERTQKWSQLCLTFRRLLQACSTYVLERACSSQISVTPPIQAIQTSLASYHVSVSAYTSKHRGPLLKTQNPNITRTCVVGAMSAGAGYTSSIGLCNTAKNLGEI